ncbi:hypothetical protein CONPUDRAFT_93823 [Coniophora puteana RWD-64-598 SS2]|uniref:Zn(2)-C6 fungal-type domain-containing protein n=1 Tax=Coniophora puteana (strain RWD-64-598) TaxID=741705 RepID=R7SHX2_CONPW|nr:uncharacterized protein CONPUDRAFT_93823 [Coniophora puteana RWD-64-598 SS2]EIW74654.1 hypothetical protein CONPUDRAFT_93823 [Coniophora puteana RWD-64-598 SS2]
MSADSYQSPLQLKGEVMDLEFTVDTDHRKRRRNRTTQSCLNCHTSKRKCDRKRPCQRCIQLGLTGLCVYEIDDPALRDDPSIDETTRLRNRIAELESLVRELRGKPHPRWADANFRDGDPAERWHSRAAKNSSMQLRRRGRSPDPPEGSPTEPRGMVTPSGVPSIKTEPGGDLSQPSLYRFSSNSPPGSYQGFQSGTSSPISTYDRNGHASYPNGAVHPNGRSYTYSNGSYGHHSNGHAPGSTLHQNGGAYHAHAFAPDSPPGSGYCPCRTNPAANHAFLALGHQLQNTVDCLRQFAVHPEGAQCRLYRRIKELNSMIRDDPDSASGSPYGTLPTPTESEIMSTHSSSNTPFHGASNGAAAAVPEWNTTMPPNGYNPYFPISSGEQNMYGNIIT